MRRRKPRAGDAKLAEAVPVVTENYMKFLRDTELDAESDPKLFAARHSAAKTALSHIEQLRKLVGVDEEDSAGNPVQAELGAARQEIEREGSPEDDTGECG